MEYSRAFAKRIDARIVELRAEIDAHERALAALRALRSRTTTTTTSVAGNGDEVAAKPARSPSRRGSRVDGTSAEAVLDAVKEVAGEAGLGSWASLSVRARVERRPRGSE
jgi:hypothetical protein